MAMEFLLHVIICSYCEGLWFVVSHYSNHRDLIWQLKGLFFVSNWKHSLWFETRDLCLSSAPFLSTPKACTLENESAQNGFWTKIKLSVNHSYLFFFFFFFFFFVVCRHYTCWSGICGDGVAACSNSRSPSHLYHHLLSYVTTCLETVRVVLGPPYLASKDLGWGIPRMTR